MKKLYDIGEEWITEIRVDLISSAYVGDEGLAVWKSRDGSGVLSNSCNYLSSFIKWSVNVEYL